MIFRRKDADLVEKLADKLDVQTLQDVMVRLNSDNVTIENYKNKLESVNTENTLLKEKVEKLEGGIDSLVDHAELIRDIKRASILKVGRQCGKCDSVRHTMACEIKR